MKVMKVDPPSRPTCWTPPHPPTPSPLTCRLGGHGLQHVQRRVEPLLLNRSGGAPVSGLPPLAFALAVHGGDGGGDGDLKAVPGGAGVRSRGGGRRIRTRGGGARGRGGGRLRGPAGGGLGAPQLGIRPRGEPAGAVAALGRPVARRAGGGEGGVGGGLPPSGFGAAREHSSFRRRLALRSHRGRAAPLAYPDAGRGREGSETECEAGRSPSPATGGPKKRCSPSTSLQRTVHSSEKGGPGPYRTPPTFNPIIASSLIRIGDSPLGLPNPSFSPSLSPCRIPRVSLSESHGAVIGIGDFLKSENEGKIRREKEH